MLAHFGSDTYGRVKTVGGTPIVTKFFMANGFPIYPLQSYYFSRSDEVAGSGIPFLSQYELSITGIPLARIDRTSVIVAYLRGLCGLLTLFGSIGALFVLGMLLRGDQGGVGPAVLEGMYGLTVFLAIGVVCGGLTYLVPLTSRRERRIRLYCGELLGFCADPARIPAELAHAMWEDQLKRAAAANMSESSLSRRNELLQLLAARCQIASDQQLAEAECTTDEVLKRLG
jgi:hypothetical protein